jgi:hypothetical protein
MKRQIPLIITAVVGFAMILASFIPHPPFDKAEGELSIFFAILAAFAMVLGAGNLMMIHTKKLSQFGKGWGYSAMTVLGFSVTLIIGVFKLGNPAGIRGATEEPGSWFQWIYDWVFSPLQATMFSLLAFFVASASYRAFRAKNREATMLLLAAFVILLGRTLVGVKVTELFPGIVEVFFGGVLAWLALSNYRAKRTIIAGTLGVIAAGLIIWGVVGFASHTFGDGGHNVITIPSLVTWIMTYPQLAGQRAIMIGICLGVISMSLRIILGVERSHLGLESD